MAGTILTPVAIWRDFNIANAPTATELSKTKTGSITTVDLSIDGRETAKGKVSIFAKLWRGKVSSPAPAILLVGDFERSADALAYDLAKKGYIVLEIDIEGKVSDKELYTKYPDNISYANYQNVKDKLYEVKGDASDTCWYEWASATRYALAYLKGLNEVSSVGGLGIGEACTVMWQVAGMDKTLDCACFALNAGWNGYRGMYKFSGAVEPQFSDEMYKYIAGVEPQAYAMHVTCPTLVLASTNSNVYDCDRAYDTVSRINGESFRAVHYSVGNIDAVNESGYQDAIIFFDSVLKKSGVALPAEMDIKCEIVNGVAVIEVLPDGKDLKDIAVFVSEETVKPSLRAWQKLTEIKEKKSNGSIVFEYSPYPNSGIITTFAQATYKSGFTIGSTIIAKKFSNEEVNLGYKSNVLYSSRLTNAETSFVCASVNEEQICVDEKSPVKVKKGAKGIEGLTCLGGLTTFKINAQKDRPKADAILMFDVQASVDTDFVVKLICDYYGQRVEYLAWVKLFGGELWQNIKLSLKKFKTKEGMPLRGYDKVEAISFVATDGEFMINNALWL